MKKMFFMGLGIGVGISLFKAYQVGIRFSQENLFNMLLDENYNV